MELKDAYQMVFNGLYQCPMFQGHYDAFNGNEHYMRGIETVMEAIAQRSHNEGLVEHFSNVFALNVERSKRNV